MKKRICAVITVLLVLAVLSAMAETEAPISDTGYSLTLPDTFTYQAPGNEDYDNDLTAIYLSDDTEIEIFSYPVKDIDWQELLAEMKKVASDAGMTKVNGLDMLWYTTADPADGATCVGYMLPEGEKLVEIDFWVGTQKAMDATPALLESIHRSKGS